MTRTENNEFRNEVLKGLLPLFEERGFTKESLEDGISLSNSDTLINIDFLSRKLYFEVIQDGQEIFSDAFYFNGQPKDIIRDISQRVYSAID